MILCPVCGSPPEVVEGPWGESGSGICPCGRLFQGADLGRFFFRVRPGLFLYPDSDSEEEVRRAVLLASASEVLES